MRAVLYALVLLTATQWAHAASLEAYGRLPDLEDLALSPGGTRLAYVRTDGDQRYVLVQTIGSKEKPTLLKFGQIKLRSISWADEDHLMIENSVAAQPGFLTGGLREWFLLNVFDLKTHKMRSIPDINLGSDDRILNTIQGEPMVRTIGGHTVIFVTGVHFVGVHGVPALFRADLSATADTLVRDGSTETRNWWVDDQGRITAEEDYYESTGRWTISGSPHGALHLLAEGHAALDYPELVGYGPEPDSLMIRSLDNGNPTVRLLGLNDGKLGAPVTREGLEGPLVDRRSLRTVGLRFADSDRPYLFFDPKQEQAWQAIEKAFDDEHARLISASDDFSRVIVLVQGPQHGYSYQLVDLDKRQAVPLGPVYSGITTLLPKRSIHYPAADGLDIQAWLTLPGDRPSKALPLIVMPHGGPATRDGYEFDWWSQALASEGYAVLQPNYRGSDMGWKFLSAGFGEFGRKMQTDLSDGVAYLAQQGTIDRSRVCILGASYGGYAALAAATLQPDVYRCAVSVSGIADLRSFLSWAEGYPAGSQTNEVMRYWDRYLGTKGPNDPALDAISPIKHVDAVRIPVLLVHGKDDTVVPIAQSRSMLKALLTAHKDAQLVELDGEDHWLSRSKTRLQMLQATTAFLVAHNPPDAPVAAAGSTAEH
jgi:dipeptidyl aminopeptidase/acylaminoacyl peptidase